jgi:hypothetical protein
MNNKQLTEQADKTIKLDMDQVIQALANYLADQNLIDEFETEGSMTYKMNNDASITVELHFSKPTMQ